MVPVVGIDATTHDVTSAHDGSQRGHFKCQLSTLPASALNEEDKMYDPRWTVCRLRVEIEAVDKCLSGSLRNSLEDGE